MDLLDQMLAESSDGEDYQPEQPIMDYEALFGEEPPSYTAKSGDTVITELDDFDFDTALSEAIKSLDEPT